MKRFLTLSLPALIALCVVGFAAAPPAAAEHPPAGPSGVTMFSTDEGVLVSWTQDDAAVHVVGWANPQEVAAAAAAGNWLDAFNHHTVTDGNSYLVPGLPADTRYWMIVGSGDAGAYPNLAWGEWRLISVDQGMALDDALTRAYVEAAVARYERDGMDATFAHYSSEESIEGERYLAIPRCG